MQKKLRIQYFSKDFRMLDDRMVSQDPEFYAGPKTKHKGPIRIEFTLENKTDIEKCQKYLGQIAGILPLPQRKTSISSKLPDVFDSNREELLSDVENKASNDQDTFITYLREHDFVFVMWDFLETFKFPINVKKVHREKYQWMLRLVRRAKDPKLDRYDPMILFGIKLVDKRSTRVVVYLDGEFKKTLKIPLPEKPRETFKKQGIMKFPHYMTAEEREKFRREYRQYIDDNKKPFTKFFNRWKPYVENIPTIPPRIKKEKGIVAKSN